MRPIASKLKWARTNLKIVSVVILLIISIASDSLCADDIKEILAEHGQFMPQFTSVETRQGRIEFAKDMLKSLRHLDDSIIALSPSQKEWLSSEMASYERTKNFSRYFQLRDSKEWAINRVKSHTQSMVQLLDAILLLQSIQREVYCWSSLTSRLLNSEYWDTVQKLGRLGIIGKSFLPQDPSFSDDSFYVNNGVFPATSIIDGIISPYLSGSLPP